MADDRDTRGPRDSARINPEQDYELKYWSEKFGVSKDELKQVVKEELDNQEVDQVCSHPAILSLPTSIQDLFKLLTSKAFILDPNQTPQFSKVETPSTTKDDPWSHEIRELENFFSTITLPERPFYLNAYTPIGNAKKFIEYNLEVAKAQNGNPTYRPYLNRVLELMKYLKANKL